MIPGSASPFFLGSSLAAATPGGLQISRSLRFNSSDSGFLSRTPAVVGNRKTWTWAGWVKRVKSSENRLLLAKSGSPITYLMFNDLVGDALCFAHFNGSGHDFRVITSRLFRDYSAWYHLVLSVDTTQATASNRIKIYVNGVQETAFHTANYPNQNTDWFINNTVAHQIGNDDGFDKLDAYLTNIHFIDGQALTPSSFTETDATTGQLIPKTYSGSYGTNGFNLLFADNSSNTASTLGKDTSGNSNNWTPNNLSVTAGAGNDSLVDSPTNYGTDTGVGGEVRGNYCTWNPLSKGTDVTLANGNLDMISSSAGGNTTCLSTFGVSSGKWYWEVTCTGSDPRNGIGVAKNGVNLNSYLGSDSSGWSYSWNAYKYNNASGTSYGVSYTANDVIGVALDADSGTLTFYKNGTSQGQAYSNLTSGPFFPAIADDSGGGVAGGSLNAGQRAFAYTAPSGFKALCTTNLPAPLVTKSNTVMDVKLYTGNGSTQTISGLGFSPDLVWIKSRNNAGDVANGVWHSLTDIVRGNSKNLFSNTTNAEVSNDTNGYLSAFTSDGFTLTAGSNSPNNVNNSTGTYVAWTWDAGTSTVSNTQGSITSQVRANATAGFSVATWSGSGSGSVTVGHGLGVAPRMMIVKDRSNARNWLVYHTSIGASSGVALNSTGAASGADGGWWNNTAPTSTVATIGTYGNESANYVGYFFSSVVGYSSFGSYVGNGSSDGPMVYTGMRPRWILIKSATETAGWMIYDTARDTYNQSTTLLYPNLSLQEQSSSNYAYDILSNGFKVRNSGQNNTSSATYIYAAFAEAPFNYSRAR